MSVQSDIRVREPDRLTASLDRVARAAQRRRAGLPAPQLLVRTADGFEFGAGERDRAFHTASVGKIMVATLALQLVERGRLDLDAPVGLPEAEGLASAPVTTRQLLTHTSGIADYFEGPSTAPEPFQSALVRDRGHRWTPAELLEYTRRYQRPIGAPGERFGYSDTGFVLLGRVIEEAGGATLGAQLHERVFEPAGMTRSCLMFHTAPGGGAAPARPGDALELAPIVIDGHDLSRAESLSCDWAGGGVVATLDDLLRFDTAWHDGTLLSDASRATMRDIRHRFRPGIHYGAGLMELRYEGFMPLLRGLPRLVGHLGVSGVHLFSGAGMQLALNFHDTRQMRRGFTTHIELVRRLRRAMA